MADERLAGVDPVIAEARERWNQCDEHSDLQRRSILEAKQFRAGEQWPPAIKLARQGTTAIQGVAAQPPRPCLTVDRLSPAVRQISNQIKSAHFAIDVLPNGFGADDETADLFQGYLRRVQINSRSEAPVEWASDQAIEGGIGWFRIRTEYVNEFGMGDPSDPSFFDQELRLERITNNLSVYDDPHAIKPTRSDSQFRFLVEDLSKEEFKRRWPHADLAGLEDFASTGNMKGWVEQDTIRIAEYWRVRYEDTELALLVDGTIATGKGIPDDEAQIKARRTVRRPIVEGFKISAVEILEQWDWAGTRIPHVPILGEELNVDGQVVLRGVIQEGMDAQRMVNYAYSGAIEIFALGSKSPYIVEEKQLADYQQIWQTANTFNYSYLPYTYVPNVPPPHRETAEAPIQAAVELMVKSEDAIKATTSIYDPSLGAINPQQRSGRAIQSLQAQSDLGSSNYPENVKRALIYAGELMVELIPKITRPGQLLQIVGADDLPEQVLVGQHFVPHQGQPVPTTPQGMPLDPTQAPKGFPMDPSVLQGLVKFYDPAAGRYAVTVDIGKSSTTKREEGAAAMGELIPHLPPEMAAVATPEYVEQLSFDGAHRIAEMLRKTLPPQLQPQDPNAPPIPPQIAAQMQQMGAQLQQAQQFIQTKQAEQQATLQKAQIDAQSRLQETQLEIASKEKIALIQASAQLSTAQAKIDAENARTFVDAMEERIGKALQLHMAKLQTVHEALQQHQDRLHAHVLSDQEHQQALQQAAQHAALQPAPSPNEGNGSVL